MNTQKVDEYLNPLHIQQAVAALDATGYESLHGVLRRAFVQAAHGKGAERHAQGAPFDQQPMQRLIELYGAGFALGQAAKKMQEAQRLPHERAVAELLGAIVYAAGAIIAMERAHQAKVPVAANDNAPQFRGPLHADSTTWCCGSDGPACKGCPRA
ncbi:hypothetical protein KB681_gp65 [Burkholderia phage Mica]|uniref:Uncharacterized protein n=1 Tax=Burkholderia phage Mica TaxID=2767579 RepID=A0A873WBK8_9CAUD|nr:hypothetical protein KB681_gp65 [Burkholderia phage Mica]QPB08647.1 hypothetical protein CPT_Mica_035 [Burkholderia phage Mica]